MKNSFKHYTSFPNRKGLREHLFPHVCFVCRKSFKRPASKIPRLCPECGGKTVKLSHKFFAPRTSDIKQWKKVEFLVAHGFTFDSVLELSEDGGYSATKFPKTLAEARKWVIERRRKSSYRLQRQ
jgi:predicted  nucleic acid-binding Zn-ribbon protein